MNGVVLDTCAVIWTAVGSAIDPAARRRIADAVQGHGVFVSPISAWEVGLLATRGRFGSLSTLAAVERWFGLFMARPGVKHAPFTAPIALESACLPDLEHRDPADRFLIATARKLGMPIVTRDRVILDYGRAGHVDTVTC